MVILWGEVGPLLHLDASLELANFVVSAYSA